MSALLVTVVIGLPGCMLRDAHRQMAQMDSVCIITGTVAGSHEQPGPFAVVLMDGNSSEIPSSIRPVDHFVMESGGEWVFAVQPARYRLLAFRSLDGQLTYAHSDPLTMYDGGQSFHCQAGLFEPSIDLVIHDGDVADQAFSIDLTRKKGGFLIEGSRAIVSLGQATAFGEVTTLDHARFSLELANDSQWRPLDFMMAGHAGVYFLKAFDPNRIPVLFVHGINGSPRVFDEVLAGMDRERFQPWLYYYPSGMGLRENAEYLTNIMLELELRHAVPEVHVVAHSMGGLVAWQFILNRQKRQSPATVGQFISLSTPWGGHGAAGRAAESSPIVLPVWKDMSPNSEFLENLFVTDHGASVIGQLPESTRMHLLFSYQGGDRLTWGTTDGVISMASLLRSEAQQSASRVYGVDATHIGILSHPEALEMVNNILNQETAE